MSTQPVGLDRPISDGDRHSHMSTVRTWTEDDVTKWLITNDLTLCKIRLRQLNGLWSSKNWLFYLLVFYYLIYYFFYIILLLFIILLFIIA